jgi:acetyl esterase/lipase
MREYDPAIAAVLAAADAAPPPAEWDVELLRAQAQRFYTGCFAILPGTPDVARSDVTFPSADGTLVPARWYSPPRPSGAAIVYLHGGGMIAGSVDLHDPAIGWYAQETRASFLSVDYRLAPEQAGDRPVEDSFAALAWLVVNAGDLGVDPARIAVMGDSAGGGLAAGAALLARDRGIPVARQILVYPMLDDRTLSPDPGFGGLETWTHGMNAIGWRALLGDAAGGPATSGIVAPARHPDLGGLPDAYIEVGDLDIFHDEDLEYARRLALGGAAVELHVHPGAPHGYDWMAPASVLADRWRAARLRAIRAV